MAITREAFDLISAALREVPANAAPEYNVIASRAGVTAYLVKGVWNGSITRPGPRKMKLEAKNIQQVRQLDGRTVAIRGQRLRRGQAAKCAHCNRKFTLLFENGTCQECQHELERNRRREYI